MAHTAAFGVERFAGTSPRSTKTAGIRKSVQVTK